MKPRALSDAQLASITDLVCARTGLAFAPSRKLHAEAGIRRAMEEVEETDADRFCQLLHNNSRVFQALIENLTVAETYFFREREQFDVLRSFILPEWGRYCGPGEPLRLWSAGCATGEEAYSLAILLEQEALAGQSRIVATDISRAALTRARKATYGAWSLRDNPPDLIDRYFHRQGDKFVLIERIRRLVEFDAFNLASEPYPSCITGPAGLDLILCRNVLIYFDQAAIERVARQMFSSLKEGGWLITGPSDPALWQHASFETVLTSAGVLYRRRRNEERKQKSRTEDNERNRLQSARHDTTAAAAPPPIPFATPRKRASGRRSGKAAVDAEVRSPQKPPELSLTTLQSLANRGDPTCAAAAVAAALESHPLAPEIHYFHAILQLNSARHDEALASLRRAIYLDRSMAVAHFALASILQRRGAIAEAGRCYRNVLAVCGQCRAEEIVPFSDGEPVGRLVEAARAQLALIRKRTAGRS